MGFTSARRAAVVALRTGNFQSEPEGVRNEKNLLGTGQVSPEAVIALLERCRGTQYSASPHHNDPATTVHVFLPVTRGQQWYIKLYFIEVPDGDTAIFMSVHKSVHKKG